MCRTFQGVETCGQVVEFNTLYGVFKDGLGSGYAR
jgi:hypothetical protein